MGRPVDADAELRQMRRRPNREEEEVGGRGRSKTVLGQSTERQETDREGPREKEERKGPHRGIERELGAASRLGDDLRRR